MQEHSRVPKLVARAAETAAEIVGKSKAKGAGKLALKEDLLKAQRSAQRASLDEPFLPRDRASALIQAAMDKRVRAGSVADARLGLAGNEFMFSNADPLWATVLGGLIKKWLTPDAKFIDKASATAPIPFENKTTVALFSDWGTGRPPALAVRDQIAKRKADYMIHLGDIYYAGQEDEVDARFINILPKSPNLKRRFALNGNHEMYGGGHGYFEKVLPKFGQPASYFCLVNDNWRIIGLDTAYKDQDLKDPQLDWLKDLVAPADGRKNIVLSHHQLFSCFEDVNARLLKKVGPLLDTGKIHAWFWGHEHSHIVYKKHRGVLARCIGHGAIPSFPPGKDFKHPEFKVQFVNRRLREDSLQGVNGFAALKLDGPDLTVEYLDEDGVVPFSENL